MSHSMKELVEITVKNTLLKAHPIGKLWLTLGDEDPSKIIGGWEKIKTYILQCSDDKHKAGETIEAGLPDIIGDFWEQIYNVDNGHGNGACYIEYGNMDGGYNLDSIACPQYKTYTWCNFQFKAGRSNELYGKSDTVQPSTVVINVWKRVS